MSQADSASSTDRRKFLTIAATAAIVAPMGADAAQERGDYLKAISRAFDEAAASLSAWYFAHADEISPEIEDEYNRRYSRVSKIARHICEMPGNTIEALQIKAKAMLWCDENFFEGAVSTDQKLMISIIRGLVSLPTT